MIELTYLFGLFFAGFSFGLTLALALAEILSWFFEKNFD